MNTTGHHAAVRDALRRTITAANGGTMPSNLDVVVGDDGTDAVADDAIGYGRTRLSVTVQPNGTLAVNVGVATHWTMLAHPGFRFARTPGDEVILIGRLGGRTMTFRFDDDRLLAELGSPLLSVAREREAIAAFDAEFAGLVAEVA